MINICNQTIALSKILSKTTNNLTFKETISLVFHCVSTLSADDKCQSHTVWKLLYDNFLDEINNQNNLEWPKITIVKNDQHKRLDVLTVSKMYIKSDNFLTHLFRLLVMENYKRTYNFKSYNYINVLNYVIPNTEPIIHPPTHPITSHSTHPITSHSTHTSIHTPTPHLSTHAPTHTPINAPIHTSTHTPIHTPTHTPSYPTICKMSVSDIFDKFKLFMEYYMQVYSESADKSKCFEYLLAKAIVKKIR